MVATERWKSGTRDLWVLALLTAVVVFTFRLVLIGARDPFMSAMKYQEPWRSNLTEADLKIPDSFAEDPQTQTYPWTIYAHENMRAGDFPLWNIRMFSGTPFTANRLTGLFNPLVYIPVRFFTPVTGLTIFYFIHYLLAAWYMYLFLKAIGLSRASSAFGSIAYILQGSYIPWMGFIVADKAYLPMVFYYLERVIDRNDRAAIIGYIISFNLMAITSYPQTAVFSVYLSFAWVIFSRRTDARTILKRCAAVIVMLIIAFLLGAMQHLPTLEFYSHSLRALKEFGYELGSMTRLEKYDSPITLISIFFPTYWGDYLNYPMSSLPQFVLALYNHAYIGILAAVGFIFTPMIWRDRRAGFFVFIAILGLLFVAWHDFYMLMTKVIPGLRMSTVKPVFLTLSSMIIVAAFVLDRLLLNLRTDPKLGKIFERVYAWILGILLGMAIMIIASKFLPGFFAIDVLYKYMTIFRGVIFIWFAGALFYLHIHRGLGIKWIIAGIILLELIDLLPYKDHFMPLIPRGRTFFKTESTQFLTDKYSEIGPFRIFRDNKKVMGPNSPMVYDLDEIGGFDSFVSADYAGFFRTVDPDMSENSRTLLMPNKIDTYTEPFWSFLNVRYLLSTDPLPALPPPWKLSYGGEKQEIYIYENPACLPRWFTVPRIIPARTIEEGYQSARAIDPWNEAVVMGIEHADIPSSLLEGPYHQSGLKRFITDPENSPDREGAGSIELERYSADELKVKFENDRDSFFVFSDIYFPGWKAWIDGNEVKIYRTNGIVKGIIVPAGSHEVRFLYDPIWYKMGWILGFIGFILWPFIIKPTKKLFQ